MKCKNTEERKLLIRLIEFVINDTTLTDKQKKNFIQTFLTDKGTK